MIGDAVLYAASRATSTALEQVSRKAAWTAVAGTFLVSALVSALIFAYQALEPKLGPLNAVALISAACLLVGLFCLALPGMIERAERRRAQAKMNTSPIATTAAAVEEEAIQAIDYFGPLRMVAAAFLFGLSAARRLKR